MTMMSDKPAAVASSKESRKVPLGVIDEAKLLAAQDFPFSEKQLIDMAYTWIETGNGIKDPDMISEAFNFRGPVVGPLSKKEYVNTVGSFQLEEAIPDLNPGYHHFRACPYEAGRVWYTTRPTGTHTGDLGGFGVKATGKRVDLPPQTLSVKFDREGKVSLFTIGYVMDNTIGNSGGLGGVFGILYAVGYGLPFPEAQPWEMSPQYKLFNALGRLRSLF